MVCFMRWPEGAQPRQRWADTRGIFFGGLVAFLVAAAVPSVAGAHASFVDSSPSPGQRLSHAPARIVLTFSEPVSPRLSFVTLINTATRDEEPVTTGVSGRRVVVRPRGALSRGAYRVSWRAVSSDEGHAVRGSLAFGVRAAAAGGSQVQQPGPLEDAGWLRALIRAAQYAALLVFAAGLLIPRLLGVGPGSSWLVPPRVREAVAASPAVLSRERSIVTDAGLLAAAFAALAAVADTQAAAGSLAPAAFRDFLLGTPAGGARVAVVLLTALALSLGRRAPRMAAGAAAGALAGVALAGHAQSASPRVLALAADWVHLLAAAVWLGGIALVVLAWTPFLRAAGMAGRLAVARHVLPRLGRLALPAFAVVVVSGVTNAALELGRPAALFTTAYGRVLAVKIALVAAIASASYLHAIRLRPRLIAANPHPPAPLERRHWWLLRAEPILGLGVAAAVALLVAFPVPPRQLAAAASRPPASPCSPCPLPLPGRDELSVADQGGSLLVAAWMRRTPNQLSGTIRVLSFQGRPAPTSVQMAAGRPRPCGPGCWRFALPASADSVELSVRDRGRRYPVALPARWRSSGSATARRLLARAQATMRRLRSVRERETVSSVPEVSAITDYRLEAPDRFSYTTAVLRRRAGQGAKLGRQAQSVVVGSDRWTRATGASAWERGDYGGGLPFRTRSWFSWTPYARSIRLLTARSGIATVALADPGTPAWWRLWVETRTGRVLRTRLTIPAHFMTQRFFAYNQPLDVTAPTRAHR